jgi:DNA-nicking Smr family endonuclease
MAKKRKVKNNKYDNLSKPEAELDFHDRGALRQNEIIRITDEFIDDCLDRGLNKVLIITGKGLHSKKGAPVIKPLLKKYLAAKPYVQRIYEARSDRGGSGALEVILTSFRV